jgi:RES domain-containing protein
MAQLELKRGGAGNTVPPLSVISFKNTCRLLSSVFSTHGTAKSPLARLAPDDRTLSEISEAEQRGDGLTKAEHDILPPGLKRSELVANVPYARIINTAFVYPSKPGARFNTVYRGVWYAARSVTTSIAEVVFHATARLAAADHFHDDVSYDEYLADFAGQYHDLRNSSSFQKALEPNSYAYSQLLGRSLVDSGSLGLVYPSVRHKAGTCIACFRPALVTNVRLGRRFRFTWAGSPKPTIEQL